MLCVCVCVCVSFLSWVERVNAAVSDGSAMIALCQTGSDRIASRAAAPRLVLRALLKQG